MGCSQPLTEQSHAVRIAAADSEAERSTPEARSLFERVEQWVQEVPQRVDAGPIGFSCSPASLRPAA